MKKTSRRGAKARRKRPTREAGREKEEFFSCLPASLVGLLVFYSALRLCASARGLLHPLTFLCARSSPAEGSPTSPRSAATPPRPCTGAPSMLFFPPGRRGPSLPAPAPR